MNYNQAKNNLVKQVNYLKKDVEKYNLTPNANAFIIRNKQNTIDAITDFLALAEQNINDAASPNLELIEVIKKQALIIAAAKIEYPTINQPIELIYEHYLSSIDEHERMGKSHKNITVKIGVI